MANPILLPRQGQSVESCIISRFYVKEGDEVTKGTLLFAYETDKASFEEEAKEDGVILALFFKEGDEVPVLTNVGVIGNPGDSYQEFVPGGGTGEETQSAVVEKEQIVEVVKDTVSLPVEGLKTDDVLLVSPRAKNLAASEGVNYRSISGTGPHGRIIEADILNAIASQPKQTPLAMKMIREEGLQSQGKGSGIGQRVTSNDLIASDTVYVSDSEIVKLPNIRKLIANAMHQSLQKSAQLTHHLSADARKLQEMRRKVKAAQKEGYRHNLTLNDMVCLAVIRTLKKYPGVNSHFLGDSIRVFKKVHLGLAVDTERGLMVPVIKNADDLSIQGLSSRMKALADSCRRGSVDPELLAPEAASFTVSNLGSYGVEMFTPVINLPQSAILGVNTIVPRPKDLGDGIYGFVPHIGLSLTYDHQALDGGGATRFLRSVANEIENLKFEL